MWSNYRPTNRIFKAHELFQYLFYGVYTSVLFNRGSTEPRVFGGNDFLLQCLNASLSNFLDHHAAFRLQAGQLVIQEVECR